MNIQSPGTESGTLPRLSTRAWFILSYCSAFLLSKYLGFSPGYAIDDYVIVTRQQDGQIINFFLTQGRYGTALVDFVLQGSALNMSSFSVVSLIASMVFSGLFFLTVLAPSHRSSRPVLAAAAAVLGAHSYYTEYVTFRQSALPMSMMFGLMWLAAAQYRQVVAGPGRQLFALSGAALAGIAAMGFNQLAVCYCAAGALYMHLQTEDVDGSAATGSRIRIQLFKAAVVAACAGALLIAGNMLVAWLLRSVFSVPVDGRAALVSASQVPERLSQLLALMPQIFFRPETVASPIAKISLLAGLALLMIPLTREDRGRSIRAAYFLLLGTVISIVPVAFSSTWWPVPRTLIAFPFIIVATAYLLLEQSNRRRAVASALLLAISAVLFSAHSNTILLNQQRLNRWDMTQAQAISLRAAAQFPDKTKIGVTGAHWYHGLAPGIAQGDMNTSAMSVGWAIDSLFDESTGSDLNVRSAPELAAHCEGRPSFPAADSMMVVEDEVIVCL